MSRAAGTPAPRKASAEHSWILDVERVLKSIEDARDVLPERRLQLLMRDVPSRLQSAHAHLVTALQCHALGLQRDPKTPAERLDIQGLAVHTLDLLSRANGYSETGVYSPRTAFAQVPVHQLKGAGRD